MRFISGVKMLSTLCALTLSTIASALPDYVYFDNNSSIRLNASIAGLPGKPIPPNTGNYPVPFALVNLACFQRQMMGNCPVEFSDANTGAKMATVYLNAATATVNQPPTLHGDYASQFMVTGWDANPISRITVAVR